MAEQFTLRGMLDRPIPVAMRTNAGRQSQLRLFVLICLLSGGLGLICAWLAITSLGATIASVLMFAASALVLLTPFAFARSHDPDTVLLTGYLLILCLTVTGCSTLGGVSAPTLPLLLPLPILAYVLLRGRKRIGGLAAYVASLVVLTALDLGATVPIVALSVATAKAVFIGSILLSACVTLVLLWQFEGLQTYWREQLRNETLQERVAGENLDLAKRTAELDSLAKSRLLASVSTDMRAPLTAIIGFSQIIGHEMMGPIGNSQYRSYAEDIESSGYKVLEMIERVLDLARLQAGEFRLRETSFDLSGLLRDIIGELKPMAENADLRVSVKTPPEQVFLFADQRSIRQILLNLLTNALHFAEFGGKASVSLDVGNQGEATLTIWNTGPGIEPERLPQLFEPCAVDVSLELDHFDEEWFERSQGLGLPVSRLLAERHGGSLTIESSTDAGTTVTVTLPPERVSLSQQSNIDSVPRRGASLYKLTPLQAPDGR